MSLVCDWLLIVVWSMLYPKSDTQKRKYIIWGLFGAVRDLHAPSFCLKYYQSTNFVIASLCARCYQTAIMHKTAHWSMNRGLCVLRRLAT